MLNWQPRECFALRSGLSELGLENQINRLLCIAARLSLAGASHYVKDG